MKIIIIVFEKKKNNNKADLIDDKPWLARHDARVWSDL